MDADIGGGLWLGVTVVLVLIFGLAIGFGRALWRNRSRSGVVERVRDEATQRLYDKGDTD